MRMTAVCVAGALLAAAGARAQQTSAIPTDIQGLYRDCQTAQGTRESIICGQYVSGIGDMMILNSGLEAASTRAAWKTFSKLSICGSPTHSEMRRAFVDWAARHDEEGSKARAVGVVQALREAWPCAAR